MFNEVAYFGLMDEFRNSFTEAEFDQIGKIYEPLGHSNPSDTLVVTSQSKVGFLSGLLSWFSKPEYFEIGKKLVKIVESNKEAHKSILDLHFYYQNKIQLFYRNRETEGSALVEAIRACIEQIEVAPLAAKAFKKEFPYDKTLPAHYGFKQLAIIYEKQNVLEKVIEVCRKAKSQKWSGDWDKRIEKALKKLDSTKSAV